MDRIIVNEESRVMRAIARKALTNNWIPVALGVFLYDVMIGIIPDFMNNFISIGTISQYNEVVGQNVKVSYLAGFYQMFFTGVFAVGMCSFLIAFFRKKDINPGYVFNGFEYYFKCFGLSVMVALFTFFWSLLLIVPGIIAAFRYSQAFYILADDSSKGIMQCIAESKYMMYGNKAKLFCLDISYIGWMILGAIPLGLVSNKDIISSDVISFALSVIATAFYCVAVAYLKTGQTVTYDMMTGNLKSKPTFNEADHYFVSGSDENKDNSGQGQF